MAKFDLKKATVKFVDGSGTPKELEIKVADGQLTWNAKRPREYITNRGVLSEVRDGTQVPIDVSFDLTWEFLRASTGATVTPEDVLKNRGEASNWVTSAADTCEPFAIDIVITYVPNCGGVQNETITISDFRYEKLVQNFKDAKITVSGRANVTKAVAVRS